MKLNLDRTSREWQEKARKFAEDELIPRELEAEMNEGRLPAEVAKRHREMAVELGFSSMDVPGEHGGLDLRTVDQVAVLSLIHISEPTRPMKESRMPASA